MEYQINTAKIVTIHNNLAQEQKRILNKSSNFYAGAFQSSGNLSSALLKIRNTFQNISKNTESIRLYLKEYVEDVESYEMAMSGSGGYVKVGNASASVRSNQSLGRGKSFSYEMDGTTLFKINKPISKPTQSTTNGSAPTGVMTEQTTGESSPILSNLDSSSDGSSLPNFEFQQPDFDMSAFDFNFDFLDKLNGIEVGTLDIGNLLNDMNFDFSKFGDFTMGAIGTISALDFGNIGTLDIGNLSGIGNIGSLNISAMGNLDIPNLDFSQQLIIKDLLNVSGIDISSLDIGNLSSFDISGIDISRLNLNAHTLSVLQNEINVGHITSIDALNAIHTLFPNLSHLNLEEIMKLYSLDLNASSLGAMNQIDANALSTGAVKGLNVTSSLTLGFGMIGGLGLGAFAMRGGKGRMGSVSSSKVSSSSASSSNSSSHKNAFAGLGEALSSGGVFGAGVIADATMGRDALMQNQEDNILRNEDNDSMDSENSLLSYLMVDYQTLEQDAFSRLKRFNQTKKLSNYLELIQDANDMRYLPSKVKLEERISFLIPSILPTLMKLSYLYEEMNQQSILPKNKESYQQLYAVINNVFEKRFKWLDLKKVVSTSKVSFRSELNLIDQLVNCGDACISKKTTSVFSFIHEQMDKVVDIYEQVYTVEVPKIFHSDMVIDEKSTSYDMLKEKLDSLSVQALLNCLPFDDAKKYLSTVLKELRLPESNLYCFQEMSRKNEKQELEVIFFVRIGNGVYPYRYYAHYPGVGLKEINSFDVKLLMKSGFQLKEE